MGDALPYFLQLESVAQAFLSLLWPSALVGFGVVAACWGSFVLLFPLRAIVSR